VQVDKLAGSSHTHLESPSSGHANVSVSHVTTYRTLPHV